MHVGSFCILIFANMNVFPIDKKGLWTKGKIVKKDFAATCFDQHLVLKMYVVEDKGGAIALMLAALLFLGTWPAVLTLLERRGRLPQHTYLDYSITNLLAAVLIALTFGQIGDSKPDMPNFLTQLTQVNFFYLLLDVLYVSVSS